MNRLSIVIPVLNQWALTRACLESLAAHTPGRFYNVVVVDNGSADETPHSCPALLHALFPQRHLYLRQEMNMNFGPACNLGARAVAAERVLFLNNDTEVTKDWLGPLFRALRNDSRLGAVSSLLLYPDSMRVQHLGVAFDPNLHPVHLFDSFPASHPVVGRNRNLQAISAAALFMHRDLFLDCGGFHEGYKNGSEDLDLCCQLLRRGMRLGCVADSVVLHHTSRTEGRYDNISDNARLLNERCRGSFSSDLHRFARQEGFEVRLNDWLEPYLAESDDRELEKDLDLAAELGEHPLWERGYSPLAGQLEAEGRHAEALAWQELCAGFFPRQEHFARALMLAALAGREERRKHWEARMRQATELIRDRERLVQRARTNLKWFKESGEQELAVLYRAWLERVALQRVAVPIWDIKL